MAGDRMDMNVLEQARQRAQARALRDTTDMNVLEQARQRAQARALRDTTERAFGSVYPAACELVAAFEKAKLSYVAEGVTHAHLWAAIALCKIVGGTLADLHKMLDVDWNAVQPDVTPAGQEAMATAQSRLVGPGGRPLPAVRPAPPVEIVAEKPVATDDEPPASA